MNDWPEAMALVAASIMKSMGACSGAEWRYANCASGRAYEFFYGLSANKSAMSFKKPFRAVPIRPGPHYRAQRQRSSRTGAMKVLGGAAGLGLLVAVAAQFLFPVSPQAQPETPAATDRDQASLHSQPLEYDRGISADELDAQQPSATGRPLSREPASSPASVVEGFSWSYRNCAAARAAGAAPIRRGEPGYGAHMDGDGDGVACEPYLGQR